VEANSLSVGIKSWQELLRNKRESNSTSIFFLGVRSKGKPKMEQGITAGNRSELGKTLKQRRLMIPLTLGKLSATTGVSISHLGRIERGDRFPSALILRRIAKPLGFKVDELFALAGYLPHPFSGGAESLSSEQVDPYVTALLSQESVETQRNVITILSVIKSMIKSLHA